MIVGGKYIVPEGFQSEAKKHHQMTDTLQKLCRKYAEDPEKRVACLKKHLKKFENNLPKMMSQANDEQE